MRHVVRAMGSVAAILLLAWGCSVDRSPTRPEALKPSLNIGPPTPGQGIDLCKIGEVGSTATFTVTATGGQVLVQSPLSLPARMLNECVSANDIANGATGPINQITVWRPDPSGDHNQVFDVTITETGSTGGSLSLIYSLTGLLGEKDVFPPDNSITVSASYNSGGGIVAFQNHGGICTDRSATNYGGPLPCVYTPPPTCQDHSATNYGGPLPCIYPGKTFSIGPSSMEGHLKIPIDSWFNGGYSFKFKNGSHVATTFTVTAKVEVPVTCPYGGGPGGTILIPLGTVAYNVPANNTNWLPTGDANSILSWMGAVHSPDLCGGFPMDNARGGIFTATVNQNPATGSLVDFRFKYRDPAAKGKVDTNCTDPNEPKRNDAATCGASWSQTVTDP